MADNKLNYILFIILSIGIILGFSIFFNDPPPRQDSEKMGDVGQLSKSSSPTTTEDFPSDKADYLKEGLNFPDEPENLAQGELITVQTPLYVGVIDTLGGRVSSWHLKKYRERVDDGKTLVNLFKGSPPGFSPLLKVSGLRLPELIPFEFNGKSNIDIREGTREISLYWDSPQGIGVRKTYSFDSSTYVVKQSLEVINSGTVPLRERLFIGWHGNIEQKGRGESSTSFIALVSNELERVEKSPKEAVDYKGVINWFGYASKYFMVALLPNIGADTVIRLTPTAERNVVKAVFGYPSDTIPTGKESIRKWEIYLGPIEPETLKPVGHNVEQAVNYGWLGFLAKPLLGFLKFLNTYIGNYGISIIVITIIIRVLFFPLTVRSMASMRQMQLKMEKFKPEMDALKERYKDDKAKQNAELMKLYSKHGVNPLSSLGGCMPMLVQIPVFIALYDVLLHSIDLRHSSFLWINDLASPEMLFDIPVLGVPFRILPLLMGVSWYISQKMTPMTAAAASDNMALQMKMMQFMPIIFTFLFWGLPSGLILYWTVSNVLSIGQQIYVNRRVIAPKGG